MPKTKPQDAIALLKADHREVEALFDKFEKARGDEKKRGIAEDICRALIVHAQIEEEIFYPACEGKVDDDMLKEARVEHDSAKLLIRDILAGGPDDDFYDAKVSVLAEQIEHHVGEEEARMEGIFSQARRAGLDLVALGEELRARKEGLLADYRERLPLPALSAVRLPEAAPA